MLIIRRKQFSYNGTNLQIIIKWPDLLPQLWYFNLAVRVIVNGSQWPGSEIILKILYLGMNRFDDL